MEKDAGKFSRRAEYALPQIRALGLHRCRVVKAWIVFSVAADLSLIT
jgi:hypothetical protein